ncbi:RNA polymerase sigma factor [Paenibacillus sp. PL91]|uniref:RNA polymerase sigma factor n=1 Tax=Paenibacillus sp. PL91 TaxID=2729538 RepID=UPI00145D81C2|nr:sigma-70 family RNA polymerase sigma factor [Paenibacillus sp. PL91]MBC9203736.1 sigma-70 family RNA polymerase sigma factor [Paenibacillus sp. PL91]
MESKLLLLLASNFGELSPELQKMVYRDYYKLVYLSIIYMVKNHASTEDIIQESFLKVVKKVPALESEAKLISWIKVVTKNSTYNYLRKHKKYRNDVDTESVFINESMEYSTDAVALEKEVELKLMTEAVGKCLKDINPEYRALIELRWKQNMSYREIAAELEIKEETVKIKLHRAREAVKKKFLQEWGDSK